MLFWMRMIINQKETLGDKADIKIIHDDYVIADGISGASMGFADADKTPFGRSVSLPILYVFKVHKNHPLRVLTKGKYFSSIYPAREVRNYKRMPADVHKDRMDYDMAAFFLAPYNADTDGSAWKKEILKDGFISNEGKKSDASLLYLLEQGFSTHSCDTLKISHVMPSQVYYHIMDWIEHGHFIISHEQTFHQKLEGRMNVDYKTAIDLAGKMTRGLEERYKSRLFIK